MGQPRVPERVRISFSPAMVNALVAGAKTQTRRFALVKEARTGRHHDALWFQVPLGSSLQVREPVYRETAECDARTGAKLVERITYRAEGEGVEAPVYTFRHATGWDAVASTRRELDLPRGAVEWCHPRFMPGWAGRLTLILTAVGRERLQAITDADAVAEGATLREAGWCMDWSGVGRFHKKLGRPLRETDIAKATPREAFRAYWCYLHSPKGEPASDACWQENPLLAVLHFTVARSVHPCWSAAS